MNTCYLICDESGAKGKANTTEKFPGEVGVMGGFCLREEDIDRVKRDLQKIVSKYQPTSGKFHITDLSENDQQSLRNEVFSYIKANYIFCVYTATHAEGFHNQYKNSGVKHHDSPSLYDELFKVLFADSLDWAIFCANPAHSEIKLVVLIDNTDKSICKGFKKIATELLEQQVSDTYDYKYYDRDKGILIPKKMTINIDQSNYVPPNISLSSIEIGPGPLTIAADIIVNSIYHYLTQKRSAEQLGEPLEDSEALKGHPLYENFYWEEKGYKSFSDTMYPHKQQRCWDKT